MSKSFNATIHSEGYFFRLWWGKLAEVIGVTPYPTIILSINVDTHFKYMFRRINKMQNIGQILAELGIEVPEDKVITLNAKVVENYRTKADYEKVVAKRDALETELTEVQTTLTELQANAGNNEELNAKLTELTKALEDEKQGRAKDLENAERKERISTFLADKKFVNAITEESIKKTMFDKLGDGSSNGVGLDEIFESLTTDKDGNLIPNILVAEEEEKDTKPQFTTKGSGGNGGKLDLKAMSYDERVKLKNENPELYASLKSAR